MQIEGEEVKCLSVNGARVHNLKNIDVEIPHNRLTVITGLSGSGKSTLAYDTIFAEGQRRYIETFSSYARSRLGKLERPDVESITGLNPVVSIDQKTVSKNPRSTIGTITEVWDYLRLLYARTADAYSYVSGEKMVKYTAEKIIDLIMEKYLGKKVLILAPLVKNRKGHYKELFEQQRKKGYLSVRVDGEVRDIVFGMKLDRYKNHSIELVVDKMKVVEKYADRLRDTADTAFKQGNGELMILDIENGELSHYSKSLMDPATGLSYSEPAPHNFSFNSPLGSCPKCKGLGYVNIIDREKVMPDMDKSIGEGGIVPLGKSNSHDLIFAQIAAILTANGYSMSTPLRDISEDVIDEIMNGSNERLQLSGTQHGGGFFDSYDGIVKYIEMQSQNEEMSAAQKWAGRFSTACECPECHGARLNREALSFRINGKNIAELAAMDLTDLRQWLADLPNHVHGRQWSIASEIVKELAGRVDFMLDVGLDYLSLSRGSATLSGGESQRIRLATQMGSKLVNVLYILDEPSIGLHQRDNKRLIQSLKQLRDAGNTVIVVEHDKDIMQQSDYIVDIGPKAGRKGGEVVFAGTPKQMLASGTLTADYLNGVRRISVPTARRQGNGKKIVLRGCCGNNLKNVDVEIPLGVLICVTGVSGSGKSSLVNGTLQPILSKRFYRSLQNPLPYASAEGIENVDKVVTVDQSPLGKLPRSNPATYTGVFDDIRKLFVNLPEARIRGYRPGRFSFNMSGGRCEVCKGNGYETVEMKFMPDVLVPCSECGGHRYNRETLEVRFKGKSIADVLNMTINQAVEFFESVPSILRKIKVLQDIGLGYVKLGQPSSTLSGGECQRVKLATELGKIETGQTLYILDEPTTGLHFDDVKVLLDVLNRLVEKGNTVIVIEHNLDVIKCADHIIDMGPEGGRNGGEIVSSGLPEQIIQGRVGVTAKYLAQELGAE